MTQEWFDTHKLIELHSGKVLFYRCLSAKKPQNWELIKTYENINIAIKDIKRIHDDLILTMPKATYKGESLNELFNQIQ